MPQGTAMGSGLTIGDFEKLGSLKNEQFPVLFFLELNFSWALCIKSCCIS